MMPLLYIAASKTLSRWGGDVGLGKQIFKIGLAADAAGLSDWLLSGACQCGDWTLARQQDVLSSGEDAFFQALAVKEKLVDPALYPRLRGESGIVRVQQGRVENFKLSQLALKGEQPDKVSVRQSDIISYLLEQALKAVAAAQGSALAYPSRR